jgi:glycosyltransferase involved in cell wall biosynthesis
MNILVLVSTFMRPNHPIGSVWNMRQCLAYMDQGANVLVFCPVNRPPRFLRKLKRFRVHSECPEEHIWEGGLRVLYPSWIYPHSLKYPVTAQFAKLTIRSKLDTVIKEFKPDFVHAHFSLPNGILAQYVKNKHGIPYAITDHNAWILDNAVTNHKLGDVYRSTHRNAAFSISVTPYMREKIEWIVPDARFEDVYNGSDPIPDSILHKPRPAERNGEFSIYCCGSLNDRKGHHILIEAFAILLNTVPNARLRISGIGPYKDKLDAIINRLQLQGKVTLLGLTSHEQVKQEMVWADVFALTSWAEPFATVYLEALSAATPVIWTSDGGINAVLRDREHGCRVPPRDIKATADALKILATDGQLRESIGIHNKQTFESQLTWSQSAKKIITLFHQHLNL